jgi:hypothetical protein
MNNNASHPRSIRSIAREIRSSWPNVWYGAEPYLRAMSSLDTPQDFYGVEKGDGIIRYFLSNAQTWRGEDARRIKAELKSLIKT